MPLITKFDPWNSTLCSCPEKLSLNPYTGCSHGCLYCYVSSYIPNFFQVREKKDYWRRLKKEVKKLPDLPISISNSSDPYISLEKVKKNTKKSLELLKGKKKLIVTKSDLVMRDLELLDNAIVSISLTTLNENLSKKLEPSAPLPRRRLKALEKLSQAKIPTTLRLDPLIPFLNDSFGSIEKIIKEAKKRGVKHVTSSTYKVRSDNFQRICKVFPELSPQWKELYMKKGSWLQGSWYLPQKLRLKMMRKVKKVAEKKGLSFACCREGFSMNTEICDGSSLLLTVFNNKQFRKDGVFGEKVSDKLQLLGG